MIITGELTRELPYSLEILVILHVSVESFKVSLSEKILKQTTNQFRNKSSE